MGHTDLIKFTVFTYKKDPLEDMIFMILIGSLMDSSVKEGLDDSSEKSLKSAHF